ESIGRYDPDAGSLERWLFAIARRKVADRLRRLYRQPAALVSDAEPTSMEAVDAPLLAREVSRAVRDALSQLPAPQRDALTWMHGEGLSVREIAARLNRTQKATENLLYRARQRFRTVYEAAGNDTAKRSGPSRMLRARPCG